jgi:hypothetical protein
LPFDEAQDLAQEVRMFFFQHPDLSARPVTTYPRAYFLRIVIRRAIDYRRRTYGRDAGRPRPASFLQLGDSECVRIADVSASANPATLAMNSEQMNCAERVAIELSRALALLNSAERSLVIRHFGMKALRTRHPSRPLTRVLNELRQMLGSAGLGPSIVRQAVESGGLERYSLIHGLVEATNTVAESAPSTADSTMERPPTSRRPSASCRSQRPRSGN